MQHADDGVMFVEMVGITVWETPGQRGDFAAQVVMPLFESGVLADVQNSPEPARPVAPFARGHDEPEGHPVRLRERPLGGERGESARQNAGG